MSTTKIMELLSRTDRGINDTAGPNGILAKLWRVILYDLNITPMRFGKYMKDYVVNPRNGVPDSKPAQTQARGNLMKVLGKGEMTFKVFMQAMHFIKAVRIRFIIEIEHENGNLTTHSAAVDLSTVDSVVTFNEEPEYTPEAEEEPAQEQIWVRLKSNKEQQND
jgi:hypothetical protein